MNESAVWKDITSHSRGDSKREPRVLECRLAENVAVKVHKHMWFGDEWLLSCDYLGLGMVELGTCDMGEAKEKAIEVTIKKLKEKRAEIDSVITRLCDNQAVVQKQ